MRAELSTLEIDASNLTEIIGHKVPENFLENVEIESDEEFPFPMQRSMSMVYDYNLASCKTLDNSPAQLLGNESAKTNQSSIESIRVGTSRGSTAQKWPS